MMKTIQKVLTVAGLVVIAAAVGEVQAQTVKPVSSKSETTQKPSKTPVSIKPLSKVPTNVKGDAKNNISSSDEWMKSAAEMEFYKLPYEYDALEPVIDKETVEIHYDRHHRGYFNKFKKAIEGTKAEKMNMYQIFNNIKEMPESIRYNSGGFYNHAVYWSNLSPKAGMEPSGALADAINKTFGSMADFQKQFNQAASGRFGSGWAWLAIDFKTGELFITSTANQDNPLMSDAERRGFPILALDVWEHAYYLHYQNKRGDYIESFWKIVNWPDVESRYKQFNELKDKWME